MTTIAELAVRIAADASSYNKTLDDTSGKTAGWASKLGGLAKGVLGGAVLGAATAAAAGVAAIGTAALNVSRDTEKAAANMVASLAIPEEKAAQFAEVARQVYGNNFAGSVVEAGETVATAYRLMGDVGEESLQRISEQAFALQDNFEEGPNETISAAKTLMENFGVTSDKAMDLIASGFQKGLNRSGDFIDTIEEYSTQFASGGASAEQFFSLLDSGLAGGALGTDKAADTFKEFRLRLTEDTAVTRTALGDLGLDAEATMAKLASGGTTAAKVFDDVIGELGGVEDPIVRARIGVALMGTQFEDLGDSAVLGIGLATHAFDDVAGAADTLNAKYNNFGDMFAGIWRKAVVSVSPATDKILELANDAMPMVEAAFNKLAEFIPPAIDFFVNAVDTGVAFVKKLFEGPLGDGIGTGIGHFEWVKTWIDENMPLIQQTVETVLGAISTFWDAHGDTIMTVVRNFMTIVETIVDTYLKNIFDLFKIVMQLINGDVEGAGKTLKGIAERTMKAFFTVVSTYLNSIQTVFGDIDWAALGRSIIEGIVAGLKGAGHLLLSAAQGAAMGAVDGIKNMLGIHSPSKVMAEQVGLPMAQGVAIGLSRNLAAMQNLDFSAMGSAAAAGMGGQGSITVNVYASDSRTAGDSVVQALRNAGWNT